MSLCVALYCIKVWSYTSFILGIITGNYDDDFEVGDSSATQASYSQDFISDESDFTSSCESSIEDKTTIGYPEKPEENTKQKENVSQTECSNMIVLCALSTYINIYMRKPAITCAYAEVKVLKYTLI